MQISIHDIMATRTGQSDSLLLSRTRSLVLITTLCFGLCSCGAIQLAANYNDEEKEEGNAFMMAIAPVLLITGDYPDTKDKNFKSLGYYADEIKGRDAGEMNRRRANEILAAMDRCFADKSVKKLTRQQVENLFGPADEIKIESDRRIYVYKIGGGQFGKRWLVTA